MQDYRNKTQDLVEKGKYEEALKCTIWFHHHALEHDYAMRGVRLSYALSDWRRLGEIYPPAAEALKKTRDEKEKKLREGMGNRDLFSDAVALNRTMEEQMKSVALFEFISEEDSAKAREYWHSASDVILEQGRYDIAQKFITDFEADFLIKKELYQLKADHYQKPKPGWESFQKFNNTQFINHVRRLIELALAINDRDVTISIRESALEVIDDERLKCLIPHNGEEPKGDAEQ